jgi:hypothetical protein
MLAWGPQSQRWKTVCSIRVAEGSTTGNPEKPDAEGTRDGVNVALGGGEASLPHYENKRGAPSVVPVPLLRQQSASEYIPRRSNWSNDQPS